jgi:hypothetical protein
MYEINYEQLIANYDQMINTLEYDSMRSGGKAKLNADTLHYMYSMKSVYEKRLIPAEKEVKKNGK